MHCVFPFSITWLNATPWGSLSPSFSFSEGVISSFLKSAVDLSPTKNNEDDNEQNIQALLFSSKVYNFGASGAVFYHMYLYVQEGLQMVHFMTCQTFDSKTIDLDTWNLSLSTIVSVQQVLLFYWEKFIWKEIFYNVSHTISGQSVCSKHF